MKKRVLYTIMALALVLSIAIPIRAPIMAQTTNSLTMTLSVSPGTANSKGALHYVVTLTNWNVPGANPAEVNIDFYPPGPTGQQDEYGPVVSLDTSRVIAVGETVVYNWNGDGGAEARPGLRVVLESIPLDEGLTAVWARSVYDGEYLHEPRYEADEIDNIEANVIWPDTRVSIDASATTVVSGASVSLTVTEENTGDVDLTDPYVEIWKNGTLLSTLAAPPDSGDAGDPGVLNVGETWSWTINSGPITSTTTFVALGFGTDPLNNEVSYDEGYLGERDEETVTVTEVEPADLGDFVWDDLNRNGIQDPNEPGIEGVTVRLLDCDTSAVLATNTTDGFGLYLFADLTPGDYKVQFVLPEGDWVFSLQNADAQGIGGELNSDADPVTGITECVTLGEGEDKRFVDAGMYQPAPATLGDFVWDDLNRNGIQDAGEPGIEGVTVRLLDCDTNAVLATNTTDADGLYLFADLTPGDYKVQFVLPEGDWVFSLQNADGQGIAGEFNSDADPVTGITECVTLAEGDVKLFVDAGMYETDLYRICGYKYEAETDPLKGLGGWTIILHKWDEDTSDWVQVGSQTTAADGSYCFTGLEQGEYRVMETLKFRWDKVYPVDPDYQVTLPNGEEASYDFYNTYTPPDITVGWDGHSVNKVAVLAPWIVLMAGMIGSAVLFVRRRQAQN